MQVGIAYLLACYNIFMIFLKFLTKFYRISGMLLNLFVTPQEHTHF